MASTSGVERVPCAPHSDQRSLVYDYLEQGRTDLEDGWSTDSMIAVWRLWNFRQEDIDVLMDGVRKAGVN